MWPALTRAGRLSYPKTTGLVVLVILLIWLNLPDFYTPTVIIESVTVPKDMEDAGLTPVVVTDDVRASVLKIDSEVPETGRGKRTTNFRRGDEKYNSVDIEVAGTKFDLSQIKQILVASFGAAPAHVIAHIDESCGKTWAFVRVEQPPYQPSVQTIEMKGDWSNFGSVIAESTLAKLKPAKLANHLFYTAHRESDARKVLEECTQRLDPAKKSDCLVVWGDIESNSANASEAEKRYSAALEWNPDSTDARTGLAWLKFNLGDDGPAVKLLNDAKSIDSRAISPYDRFIDISLRIGDVLSADSESEAALDISPGSAAELSTRAWIRHLLGDEKQAAELLLRATAVSPESAVPFETRAEILLDQGFINQAKEEWASANKLDPDDIFDTTDWGTLLAGYGYMSEAELNWNAALRINPHSAYVNREWAAALPWDRDDDLAAIAKLQQALKIVPGDSELHRDLANRYAHLADARAEGEYQQAVDLNPSNIFALADLGSFLAGQGLMSEAESKWNAALKINPGSSYVYKEWADAFPWDRNDDLAAVEKLQAALRINHRDPELHRYLANRLANLGDARAEVEYYQGFMVDPENASLLIDWGSFLAQEGRMSDAEWKWNSVLKNNPGNANVYRSWANALPWDQTNDLAAIAKLQTALSSNPLDPELHRCLANRYANLGDTRADDEYLRATQLDPGGIVTLTEWGRFLAQRGDISQAETKWMAALRISPRNVYVYSESADELISDEYYQCGAVVLQQALQQALMLNGEDQSVLERLLEAEALAQTSPELSTGCGSL